MPSAGEIDAHRQAGEWFRMIGDYRYDLFAQKFLGAAADPYQLALVTQEARDAIAIDHALRYREALRVEYSIGWAGDRLQVRLQIYPQAAPLCRLPRELGFDRETLSSELLRLEKKAIAAPTEYRQALRELAQHAN